MHDDSHPAPHVILAPSWPGLKLGVMRWAREPTPEGSGRFFRWRGVLTLSGDELASFARMAMERVPVLREKIPQPGGSLPVAMAANEASGLRARPESLADAQAMAAILWMSNPLFDRHDDLVSLATREGADDNLVRQIASCTLQFPRSPPSEFDPGSEGDFRLGFCCNADFDDAVHGPGERALFTLIVNALDPIAMAPESALEESSGFGQVWRPAHASRAWESSCLGEWVDLWSRAAERKQISQTSQLSHAGHDNVEADTAKGPGRSGLSRL